MKRAVVAVALVACHAHGPPKNVKATEAGVSIAVYERDGAGYSVIDDRRWIELGNQTSILLSNIDPGADLASLVLEPTNPALHVGSCTRERLPERPLVDNLEEYSKQQQIIREAIERERRIRAIRGEAMPAPPAPPRVTPGDARYVPVVRCEVNGPPGKYLVRMLYVSTTLRYRAQHDVALSVGADQVGPDGSVTRGDGTKATVISRFALETPSWRQRAEVVLFDGVPGAEHPPKEVTRGSVELDGSVAILAIDPQQTSAEIRRVYDGAVITDGVGDQTDPMWGRESQNSIWVWLDLGAIRLAPGPIHIHLEQADGPVDVDVPSESRKQEDEPNAPLRLPLWADDELRGNRMRTVEYSDGNELTERYVFSIGNTGDVPRDVYIEEKLRTAAKRKIDHPWPKKSTSSAPHDMLRTKLEVKPRTVTRAGYTLTYTFSGS
ncbi:MAG TPA: hypothetical protein VL326_30830 [Kofleriaceae bacterium]|nr:hypothetical protein [Kofleriaceae bacterium]